MLTKKVSVFKGVRVGKNEGFLFTFYTILSNGYSCYGTFSYDFLIVAITRNIRIFTKRYPIYTLTSKDLTPVTFYWYILQI